MGKTPETKKEIRLKDRISKCTPRALRLYHQAGLDEMDPVKFTQNFAALACDESEAPVLLISAMTGVPITKAEYDEIDVEEFREATFFFGEKSLGILRGLTGREQN